MWLLGWSHVQSIVSDLRWKVELHQFHTTAYSVLLKAGPLSPRLGESLV
jgi:hypothetical protein